MKIITLTNRKGGCGKTTTTAAIGNYLSNIGKKVLLIDLDAQCNLSYLVRAELDNSEKSILNIFMSEESSIINSIQHLPKLDFIACNKNLDNMIETLDAVSKVFRLKKALKEVKNSYDYVLIDTPPALNAASVNALTASTHVIIPANADVFSLQGAQTLAKTIGGIQEVNEDITICGILITRLKNRTSLGQLMTDNFTNFASQLETKIFNSKIRDSILVQESQLERKSIFDYKAPVVDDYLSFCMEFVHSLDQE